MGGVRVLFWNRAKTELRRYVKQAGRVSGVGVGNGVSKWEGKPAVVGRGRKGERLEVF
jgi:lipoprotein-anchoring transpeptidase ErfK/SrfK